MLVLCISGIQLHYFVIIVFYYASETLAIFGLSVSLMTLLIDIILPIVLYIVIVLLGISI